MGKTSQINEHIIKNQKKTINLKRQDTIKQEQPYGKTEQNTTRKQVKIDDNIHVKLQLSRASLKLCFYHRRAYFYDTNNYLDRPKEESQ